MNDHKLADDELIKLLNQCHDTEGIVASVIDGYRVEAITLQRLIAILNRQSAELDDLKRDTVPRLQDALKRANKYGAQADEDIKHLSVELDAMRGAANSYKMHNETARAEAIKEFAKNIKKHFSQTELIEYIDSLVEETEMGLR